MTVIFGSVWLLKDEKSRHNVIAFAVNVIIVMTVTHSVAHITLEMWFSRVASFYGRRCTAVQIFVLREGGGGGESSVRLGFAFDRDDTTELIIYVHVQVPLTSMSGIPAATVGKETVRPTQCTCSVWRVQHNVRWCDDIYKGRKRNLR